MRRRITIGSRGSRLALLQTGEVVGLLKKNYPELDIQVKRITTSGDRDRTTPLDDPVSEGVFVREIEDALLRGEIDLAVHSLKDMPVDLPRGLCLAAVTARVDPRDVLVARLPLDRLPAGSRLGTDSLRRAVQLKSRRADLTVCPMRGNVDTRIRKVISGEFDGAILAAAGVLRLGMEECITEYLPPEVFLPAVGQGALGIEVRDGDRDAIGTVSVLNHLPTWRAITAERTFLRALGGGCRAPIAALGCVTGSVLELRGMVADASDGTILRASLVDDAENPEGVGLGLAQKMLEMGAGELIRRAGMR